MRSFSKGHRLLDATIYLKPKTQQKSCLDNGLTVYLAQGFHYFAVVVNAIPRHCVIKKVGCGKDCNDDSRNSVKAFCLVHSDECFYAQKSGKRPTLHLTNVKKSIFGPDAAQGFEGNTQIGGNMRQLETVSEVGKTAKEGVVPLLRILKLNHVNAFL